MAPLPEVHLLAGLNGSGKTAFARELEVSLPGVRFTLDEWMLRLHQLEFDHPDYPAAAARCRELIWTTAVNVLRAGAPVILDWNLWSRARRAEWWNRACAVGAPCVLHYVNVPINVAIIRAAARVDPAAHTLAATDIRHLAGLFEPPSATEGFALHEVSWPRDL